MTLIASKGPKCRLRLRGSIICEDYVVSLSHGNLRCCGLLAGYASLLSRIYCRSSGDDQDFSLFRALCDVTDRAQFKMI